LPASGGRLKFLALGYSGRTFSTVLDLGLCAAPNGSALGGVSLRK
jgi:hypothetical protein